jgi:hypothetical protein
VPFIRRDFAGGAASTTLVGSITALSTSWQIADSTGWPVGTNGPFYAVFNRLGPGPTEKVLVASLSGSTVTLSGTGSRGVDDTTAQAWAAPTSFEHCSTAVDADEANLAVQQLIGQVAAKGDVFTGKSANRFQRTPIGANNSLWITDSSQPGNVRFDSLPTGAINSPSQIAPGVINTVQIFSDAILRDAAIPTPTVGNACVLADHGSFLIYNGTTVGWTPPWNQPWGPVGPVGQAVANQGPIIGFIDLTGLGVTFTAVPNRRYRVTADVNMTSGLGSLNVTLALTDGANVILKSKTAASAFAAGYMPFNLSFDTTTPSTAGSYTFKLRAERTGADTLTAVASATFPNQLTVEDIGPNGDPS